MSTSQKNLARTHQKVPTYWTTWFNIQFETSSKPYLTLPYHTISYNTIQYHTIPYNNVPYHTIPYHTMPYYTIPCHTTMPCHTIPYCSVPYIITFISKVLIFLQNFSIFGHKHIQGSCMCNLDQYWPWKTLSLQNYQVLKLAQCFKQV